jgi:hypothetical protein
VIHRKDGPLKNLLDSHLGASRHNVARGWTVITSLFRSVRGIHTDIPCRCWWLSVLRCAATGRVLIGTRHVVLAIEQGGQSLLHLPKPLQNGQTPSVKL